MRQPDAQVEVRVDHYGMNPEAQAFVANTEIRYDWLGRIKSVGNIAFSYFFLSGALKSVGNAKLSYGFGGRIIGITKDYRVEIIVQTRPRSADTYPPTEQDSQ